LECSRRPNDAVYVAVVIHVEHTAEDIDVLKVKNEKLNGDDL
jgi:hypothetical protein